MPAAEAARRASVDMDGEIVGAVQMKSCTKSETTSVTAMKRPMAPEPVQIVIEAVFDLESDGGLEKG
jgi:hypothetical protein